MHEVYCFGHVSTGRIVKLAGGYPEPDGYCEVSEILANHAGEATGSALVLAQLGVSVALEGNWIGDTPECRATLAFLKSRGIDCSGLLIKPGYQGVNEIVLSDGVTRTVFGRYCDLLFTTRQWEPPDVEKIRAAKLVCLDPTFGEETLAVAACAHEAGIPLVTSDANPESTLVESAAAVVLSNEYFRRDFPEAVDDAGAREKLFQRYLEKCPGLVVFTSGSDPLWYGRGSNGKSRHEMKPFKVEVVDTAGAGDSFRGGLIFGMSKGWPDDECVQFASAVAALVCTTAPGCVHPPTRDQVELFLRKGR